MKRKQQLRLLGFVPEDNGDWIKGSFIISKETIMNAGYDKWNRLLKPFNKKGITLT